MALTIIPNQILSLRAFGDPGFNERDPDCDCVGRDFCQLVEPTDATEFQVAIGTVGAELVTDGAFVNPCSISAWSCGVSWDIPSGSAILTSGTGNAPILQDIGLLDNRLYKVVFTVVALTGGNLQVRFGGSIVYTVQLADGVATYTLFTFTGTLANQEISFTGSSGAVNATIDDVSVTLQSTVGFKIKDKNGDVDYEEYDGTSVTYPTTTGSSNPAPTNPTAKISIDWTLVVVGSCYTICVVDVTNEAGELIANGGFDSGASWDITNFPGLGGWVITGGVADHLVNGGGAEVDLLEQTLATPLVSTKCYELTFDILNYVSGTLNVRGLSTGDLLASFSAGGSKTIQIDNLSDTGISFEINVLGVLEIDNVSMFVRNECKTPDFESECFKLETTFECSKLFTATNDENAFGLDFTAFPFTQVFRHCFKLDQPVYPRDPKNTHRDSAGNRDIIYSSITKVSTLRMDRLPEYLHDAFSLFLEHDTFTIDTVEYTYEENDYQPDWVKSSLVAGINLDVIKENQNLVNANCT